MSWPIKQHDLEPAYTGTLMAGDEPIPLTGRTVKFIMTNAATGVVKVNQPATIVDPDAGMVSYTWMAGDTDTVGLFKVEWEVTSAGRPRTVPSRGYLYIEVWADLG